VGIILCEEGIVRYWLLDSIRYINYIDNLLYFTRIIFHILLLFSMIRSIRLIRPIVVQLLFINLIKYEFLSYERNV